MSTLMSKKIVWIVKYEDAGYRDNPVIQEEIIIGPGSVEAAAKVFEDTCGRNKDTIVSITECTLAKGRVYKPKTTFV